MWRQGEICIPPIISHLVYIFGVYMQEKQTENVDFFLQQEFIDAELKFTKMVNDHIMAMSQDDQFLTYEEAYDDLVDRLVTAEQLKLETLLER